MPLLQGPVSPKLLRAAKEASVKTGPTSQHAMFRLSEVAYEPFKVCIYTPISENAMKHRRYSGQTKKPVDLTGLSRLVPEVMRPSSNEHVYIRDKLSNLV